MAQWPPSPCVEDEEVALAREHLINESIQPPKSENQPAPSRGTVDQYPIILNSNLKEQTSDKYQTPRSSKQPGASKTCNTQPPATSSSDESIGPETPPSSTAGFRKAQIASEIPGLTSSAARSQSTTRVNEQNHGRGRPQVTRIQTDISGELQSLATGRRRAPSPYSYTPQTGTVKVDSRSRYSGDSFLSPSLTTSSPIVVSPPEGSAKHSRHAYETDSSTDSERRAERSRPVSRTNSIDDPHKPIGKLQYLDVEQKASQKNQSGKPQPDLVPFTPPRSRKSSRDSHLSGTEDYYRTHKSSNLSKQTPTRMWEFPYASSAEELGEDTYHRAEKYHEFGSPRQRRRSSYRRERPLFEDHSRPHSPNRNYASDAEMRQYNVERQQARQYEPVTPLSAGIQESKAMEDYFAKAFRDNHTRRRGYVSRSSPDDSVLVSPPTSPPRTPRVERKSQQDYFESAPVTNQRPQQRSRPPSLEETQIREMRVHTSLLSQATVGAAIAARVTPSLSRTPTTASESTASNSSSKYASTQRSRKSSPVLEERATQSRNGSLPLGEDINPVRSTMPSLELPKQHSPRSSVYFAESSTAQGNMPRTYIPNGYTHNILRPPTTATLNPGNLMANPMPGNINHAPPPMQRSKSTSSSTGITRMATFAPPKCPRTQPTRGCHDWSTFRDVSNIEVCPTCVAALRVTYFHDYFVPSLSKPYNEATMCAMNIPWYRIAIIQSIKQNKFTLDYLRNVSNLPVGTRPCNGPRNEARIWWNLVDPENGRPVTDFHACSACVSNIDTVFPEIGIAFKRDRISQERICNLHPGSKHFQALIEQFEQVTNSLQAKISRGRSFRPLIDRARKASKYRECARDELLNNRAWHFMPDLPEFTICEECFEEVVWPVSDRAIARDISKTTRMVPVRYQHSSVAPIGPINVYAGGISCQLYSDRMRQVFHQAVANRNFDLLRDVVKTRVGAQQRLKDMNRLYEMDQKVGIDRRAELERNNAIWRQME